MSRLDLLRYFTPIAGKLAAVEDELQSPAEERPAGGAEAGGACARPGRASACGPLWCCSPPASAGPRASEDVRFGAIFELIHTATLVHDDVIDHATLRRSKPTLNAVWGNTLTVLFGDLLYLHAMSSAIRGTQLATHGDLRGGDHPHDRGGTDPERLPLQRRTPPARTTSRSRSARPHCSSAAAPRAPRSWPAAPRPIALALRTYGLEIGRAFQLVDDLLDYTATSEQLGKPALSRSSGGQADPAHAHPAGAGAQGDGAHRPRASGRPGRVSPITPEDEKLAAGPDRRGMSALSETRELATRASKAAVAALSGVDGDAAIKKLLLEIPEVLLERSR